MNRQIDDDRVLDGSEWIFRTWIIASVYAMAIAGILAVVVAAEFVR